MVLTDNIGNVLMNGYVSTSERAWKDSSLWKGSGLYTISNFKGFKESEYKGIKNKDFMHTRAYTRKKLDKVT